MIAATARMLHNNLALVNCPQVQQNSGRLEPRGGSLNARKSTATL